MGRRFVISAVLVCAALSAAARTRPHYGGTLRIETQGDPWQMPDGIARRLVLDTLTTVGDTGGARPALAVGGNRRTRIIAGNSGFGRGFTSRMERRSRRTRLPLR